MKVYLHPLCPLYLTLHEILKRSAFPFRYGEYGGMSAPYILTRREGLMLALDLVRWSSVDQLFSMQDVIEAE